MHSRNIIAFSFAPLTTGIRVSYFHPKEMVIYPHRPLEQSDILLVLIYTILHCIVYIPYPYMIVYGRKHMYAIHDKEQHSVMIASDFSLYLLTQIGPLCLSKFDVKQIMKRLNFEGLSTIHMHMLMSLK